MSTRTDTRRAQIRRRPVLRLFGRNYNWWPDETGPGYRTIPVLTGELLTEEQDAAIETGIDQLIAAGGFADTEEQRDHFRNTVFAAQGPTVVDTRTAHEMIGAVTQ